MHYLFPPGFLSGFLWGERPTALGTPRRFQGCRPADPLPPIPNSAPKRPWPPARQPTPFHPITYPPPVSYTHLMNTTAGDEVIFRIDGPDEEAAMKEVEAVLETVTVI